MLLSCIIAVVFLAIACINIVLMKNARVLPGEIVIKIVFAFMAIILSSMLPKIVSLSFIVTTIFLLATLIHKEIF